MTSADIGVRAGDVLAGKYRVERVLGTGGMGVVVAAHHIRLEERVALKFLLPRALENPDAVGRFLREARAAAKIKGEHVARVSDVGELESGAPYIVMEYLDGLDLETWLLERGVMPVTQATDFILQACEALADAHSLGIVHRDLKPANLFCVERSDGGECIKVLDFGISKVMGPGLSGPALTRTSAMVGTPFYMSPEHMQASRNVDARTDIWSLGVILFELVAGRPPFEAEAVTELAIKIATAPHISLRTLRPEVPAAFEEVIARCLEKDRDRRFQSVGELAVALRSLGGSGASQSVERILGTLRKAGSRGDARPSDDASQPSPGRTLRLDDAVRPAASSDPFAPTIPSTGSGARLQAARDASAPGAGSWPSESSARPRRKTLTVVAAGAVLAALGLGALGAATLRAGPSSPSALPASPAPVTPGPPPAAETVAAEALVVAAPAASSARELPVPSPPAAPSAARRQGAARPPSTGAPAKPVKASCDPPYYFDAQGNRMFKTECL